MAHNQAGIFDEKHTIEANTVEEALGQVARPGGRPAPVAKAHRAPARR